MVGALGISSSYGAPTEAFEEAFDRGCNYFTWGTFIKGRSKPMQAAVRNLVDRGLRDKLVLASFSYSHSAMWMGHSTETALRALGTDYLDVLLLGYHNGRPWQRILNRAQKLKEQGKIRFIGLSSHNRKLFPELVKDGIIDVFHVRYNAAHRGAETETFPFLTGDDRPGVVSFTATRWGKLLKADKLPPDEPPASAADCYRFVLSHPTVDVCMAGTRSLEQMRHALGALDLGPLSDDEMTRMRRIGDLVYGKKRA